MFAQDAATMLSDFGVDATLAGSPVRGIFADAYASTFGGLVDQTGPLFITDVSATVGASLVIATKTYTVAAIEPDVAGFFRLRLK